MVRVGAIACPRRLGAPPPLAEKHEIIRRAFALFALADCLSRRLAVAPTDKVPQAILATAFRGELVPTEAELARAEGRDYEPASYRGNSTFANDFLGRSHGADRKGAGDARGEVSHKRSRRIGLQRGCRCRARRGGAPCLSRPRQPP